jgi:hypothetical protein
MPRRTAPLLAGPAVAVAAVFVLVLSSCAKVDVPPAAASPVEVVRAYLDAIQSGNCTVLSQLATRNQAERAWCGRGLTISHITIGDPVPDPGSIASKSFEQAVYVPVRLDVEGGADSVEPGMRDWGYVLVRDADVQQWRIADEGTKAQVTQPR